jgi:hypothetical protein
LINPQANYIAIFQDDFVTYKNLRYYLEQCPSPKDAYWNLFSFPKNESKANGRKGWYPSNQKGYGAVALIFPTRVLLRILSHPHMIDRPLNEERGWKAIDGGIVTAARKQGISELVHSPSLVQHTGFISSMGNDRHPLSKTFLGEDFDALELLKS